jgi:branched-chain amino acid transport system permease protein
MSVLRTGTGIPFLRRFNGPQTAGSGIAFWAAFAVVIAALALSPLVLGRFQIINFSNFLIFSLLAMSLCLIWGYAGILSLGQAVFLGVGGYAFGIVAINLITSQGNTNLAVLAGILVPVLLAAVIGSLMFYARLKGVYVAILMLVVSRLFEIFLLQTADPRYRIGAAALGGFNGLRPASPSDPLLPNLVLGFGTHVLDLDGRGLPFFYLVLGVVVVVYLALRWLLNSSFGYVLVAIREDQDRTETFGYDVRLVQLMVFCIAAGVAGLAGLLYTAWGTYIHPTTFGVANNILPVIWVGVAGRKDLTAALVGAFALQWLSLLLASKGEYALIVMGTILVVGMLLAPEGVLTALAKRLTRRGSRVDAPAPNPVKAIA